MTVPLPRTSKFASLSDTDLRNQIFHNELQLKNLWQQNTAYVTAHILELRLMLLELKVEWLERQ